MAALEQYLQQFATLLEAERATNWSLGDLVAEAVREFGRGVIGKFAEVARCSAERIRQLVRVSVAFPPGARYPDIPWSVYREVAKAAKRLNQDPQEVLRTVLDNELSLADIAALGKENAPKARLSKRCDYCNSKVTVEADGALAGKWIYCPVCAADGQQHLLGVLEVGS